MDALLDIALTEPPPPPPCNRLPPPPEICAPWWGQRSEWGPLVNLMFRLLSVNRRLFANLQQLHISKQQLYYHHCCFLLLTMSSSVSIWKHRAKEGIVPVNSTLAQVNTVSKVRHVLSSVHFYRISFRLTGRQGRLDPLYTSY